jgi:diaminopimelate epimerase
MSNEFKFYKYQSLGNDFVLLDFLAKSQKETESFIADPNWPEQVKKMCDRHFGIGADGVLLVLAQQVLIFNADGTQAEKCFNGLRCVAHYLYTKKDYPEKINIVMGKKAYAISIQADAKNLDITLNIEDAVYNGKKELTITKQKLTGHMVDVGNPHFVIEAQTTMEWLKANGKEIEQHQYFPNRANIEFVWQDQVKQNTYNLFVYERGCGITLACGTGAAAVVKVLLQTNKIEKNQQIIIHMSGGKLMTWIDGFGIIWQKGTAAWVFAGHL